MKTLAKQILCLCLSLVLVLGPSACGSSGTASGKKAELLSLDARPDAPSEIPEVLNIDWNYRYTFAELESQLSKMAETYPDITALYSICTSWQERDLWCMEITNKAIPAEEKTGIGVFANIHGGERESASSAMYTAWWLTLCSGERDCWTTTLSISSPSSTQTAMSSPLSSTTAPTCGQRRQRGQHPVQRSLYRH